MSDENPRPGPAPPLVYYLATLVDYADVPGTIARAKRWLGWLRLRSPGVAVVAPWLAWLEAASADGTMPPAELAAGMDAVVASRCDALVVVGNATGTVEELDKVRASGVVVHDLRALGLDPPAALWA